MLKDPKRFRRLLAVSSLLLAPLLMVAGVLVAPFEETKTDAAYLAAVASDTAGAELSAFLLHLGFLLLVPSVWAMALLLGERSPVLGNLGLALGTLGAIGNSGIVLMDFSDIALVQELNLADAVDVYGAVNSSWGFALSAILGIPLLAIGLLLLTVALCRAGELPWAVLAVVPAAVVLGMVLPTGRWEPLVVFTAAGAILFAVARRLAQPRSRMEAALAR
jgi:hypothetical protein